MRYDDFPEPNPNRHAFVAEQLERLIKPAPKPEHHSTPAHLLFPDEFIPMENGVPISKALAKKIGMGENV